MTATMTQTQALTLCSGLGSDHLWPAFGSLYAASFAAADAEGKGSS